MSDTTAPPPTPAGDLLAGLEHLIVPLARLYLGPAAFSADVSGSKSNPDARVLQLALAKLVIEAGTLPPPGTPYAPHSTKFTVDDKGNPIALDLPYVLAALRAGAAWAAAGPTANTTAPALASAAAPATGFTPAPSARELRLSARATSYATASPAPASMSAVSPVSSAPARTGGCGCRGSAASSSSFVTPSAARRAATATKRGAASCADPKPRCDCGGSCGGRGCDCSDCIPRGARAGDLCQCGTCTPPADPCLPWTPSCETRNRLRTCLRDIFCELLLCVETAYCADASQTAAQRAANLQQCIADLVCKALRCVREALCPPAPAAPPPSPLPPMIDCLPCSYAVEDPR